jgi:hypothetical protein
MLVAATAATCSVPLLLSPLLLRRGALLQSSSVAATAATCSVPLLLRPLLLRLARLSLLFLLRA